MKSIIIVLWSLLLILGGMGSAFGYSYTFTDSFEGTTLDTFWSVNPLHMNAEYSLSSDRATADYQSLKLNSTTPGTRYIILDHQFDQVMQGTVSVMFYDSGYSSLNLYSQLILSTGAYFTPPPTQSNTHIGVMDWDGDFYYAGGAADNVQTTLPRTVGWHEFKAIYDSSGARLLIDEHLVRSIPEYIGFDRLYLTLSGPGYHDGVVYFDQFSVNANPVPIPGSVLLMGSGLLGLVGWRRFRKS